MNIPNLTWLDLARVARRAWSDFAYAGYGLANVCKTIGHNFKHHDALEDAKAAAAVITAASAATGLDIAHWLKRVREPINSDQSSSNYGHRREGNPDAPLYGEVVVFTGELSIPRREAADLAASIGCTVIDDVTRKMTILVVGDQDVMRLAGHTKSAKHRKAEELISGGHEI